MYNVFLFILEQQFHPCNVDINYIDNNEQYFEILLILHKYRIINNSNKINKSELSIPSNFLPVSLRKSYNIYVAFDIYNVIENYIKTNPLIYK